MVVGATSGEALLSMSENTAKLLLLQHQSTEGIKYGFFKYGKNQKQKKTTDAHAQD